MAAQPRTVTPRQVANAIAVFFLAYGTYARWFAAEQHPVYAAGSWVLGVLWLALAWASGRPRGD